MHKFIPYPDLELKKKSGKLIVLESQVAPIMEALAMGIAPDVFGRTPLDAVRVIGPARLYRIAKITKMEEVQTGRLITKLGAWYEWRPDPEFTDSSNSYRLNRFFRAKPLGKIPYPGGYGEWAEIQWDSGHSNVSTFFSSLLKFGVALEREEECND